VAAADNRGVKDAALFVSTFGSGQPTLCLHGIESHGLRFLGLAQRVPGLHVVAPDLRGHGRSPMEGPWTLDQQMSDLLPLFESLGPDPLLLGHSYGGLLAWELARAVPDRISGLILVDPAIAVDPEMARLSAEEYTGFGQSWEDAAAAFAALSVDRCKEALWSVALDVAVDTRVGSDGRLHPLLSREAVQAGWSQMQAPLRASEWRGPTLLLEAGRENGAFTSLVVIDGMRRQLGAALEHIVLDATHSIPSDYPDLLAEHVDRLVKG
jgi:lipase